jgi:hypothetical protein
MIAYEGQLTDDLLDDPIGCLGIILGNVYPDCLKVFLSGSSDSDGTLLLFRGFMFAFPDDLAREGFKLCVSRINGELPQLNIADATHNFFPQDFHTLLPGFQQAQTLTDDLIGGLIGAALDSLVY